MNKKRILILAETIDVDSTSAGKGNAGFINSLINDQFSVKVYHYSHKEITIQGVETILIKEYKFDANYLLSRVQRVLQQITGKNFSKTLENRFGFSFTFKNDAKSMALAIGKEIDKTDLIITLSKGASFRTHAALLLLPRAHKKWLAFVHDPYPFHCYPQPYNWTEAGHVQKEAFFREVSEKAEYSGFPSLLLKKWMSTFFPNFSKTGIVLPHQNFPSSESLLPIPPYFKKECFTVLHAGSLLDHRNPYFLIEGYKAFLATDPEAAKKSQLLLIGAATAHEPTLSDLCDTISSIYKSKGYVHHKEVQVLQKNATCLMIIEAVAEVSPFLPGKFPHYINEDKPIIHLGPDRSETKRLLGEEYPYSCEANDVDKIAAIFKELFIAWQTSETLKLNRPDLKEYCSKSYFINQLNTILN